MALGNTGITTSLVGNTLGTTNRNVGGLCTNSNINPWSKWKPILDSAVTLNDEILKNRNYGIKIVQTNNPTELVRQIKANANQGYTYLKPVGGSGSPYRLGDFRNYEHYASIPCETSYKEGATQNIGGVTSSNHSAFERPLEGIETNDHGVADDPSRKYLTKSDIYKAYDKFGNPISLHRGAVVTDGTNTVWYSNKLYWWTPQMQKFANKTVQIYEFLTNATSTPTSPHTGNADDIFMALPLPLVNIQVKAETMAGSQKVQVTFKATQRSDRKTYDFELQFSSVGSTYEGGTINNIVVKLCKDSKGVQQIATARGIPSTITLGREETSMKYTGTLLNNTTSNICWLCLWYDNSLQKSIQAMMEMPQPIL